MSNNSFKVGDKIIDINDIYRTGKVISTELSNPKYVAVEWDYGSISKILKTRIKLLSYNSEFEQYHQQLKEKLTNISYSLIEAIDYSYNNGLDLSNHLDILRPMLDVINDSIDYWASSSRRC